MPPKARDPYDSRDTLTKAIMAAAGKGWTRTVNQQEVDGLHVTWTRGTTSVAIVFDAENEPVKMTIITAEGRMNFNYLIGPALLARLQRGI